MQYGLCLRKLIHTNLPQAGFKLRSLGPQASVLPIAPTLLVTGFIAKSTAYLSAGGYKRTYAAAIQQARF